jgi:UPF0716 protein FxsA
MRTQKQTVVGPGLGLLLLAAIVGVPLLEIALFIKVGGWIGLGPTLALIVLTAVLGVGLLRWQGISVLMRAQHQLAEGSLPVAEVFEGFCLVIAGALLLIPGFFTDAVGGLLLVPVVRRALYRQARRWIEAQAVDMSGLPRSSGRGAVIEAEYEEIETEYEKIGDEHRSTGQRIGDQPMPPPQGHWGRRP